MAELEPKLKRLPAKPGVYLFRDEKGDVLYVGKAKSLRPRVRSYFQAGRGDTRSSIPNLVGRIADLEVIVTATEVEALHLEQNLVKRYRPPFNVRLRDDKSFPYIAVTIEDDYPRVMFTRERHRRGVLYFGPYANAKKVRETLDVLNRVFQFRPCEGPKPGRHSGIPCLDFHIERCHAPCVDYISKAAYGEIIEGVINFLSGDTRTIVRELQRQMRDAAAEERFEDAARYRNRLFAIENLAEKQGADRRETGSIDVIGIAVEGDRAAVQVFPLRGGKMIDRHGFHLENVEGQDVTTVLEAFCLEYYGNAPSIPPQLVVPTERDGARGARAVPLRAPRLARRGARAGEGREAAARRARGSEREARARLGDPRLGAEAPAPGRGAGGAARGAQPREPAHADRVLRHLEHPGPGDRRLDGRLPGRGAEEGALPQVRRCAGSTARTTSRRWRRSCRAGSRGCAPAPRRSTTRASRRAPNLVVIDGGKGQLSAALAAMQAYDLPRVAVISLAKRIEEVFVPGRPDPILLDPHSPDCSCCSASATRRTASRSASTASAARRGRASRSSTRSRASARCGGARCSQHFGSTESVLAASQEELEGVPGVPAKTARSIYAQLHKTGRG